MAFRVFVLLVLVLALSGCDRDAPLLLVKAVAAGVPSLAPFFDEDQGLGRDAQVRSQTARGGLQQGDTPGLYGGSKQPALCDVEKLEAFLTDPANDAKARAWAAALDITTAGIPDYLDRLTPVLLRHDTLVQNHDYKKGKAVPYNSLLQAGITILVDEQGLPAVKCSCGNPLRPFEGDTSRIKVDFEDGNEKWKGYERTSVLAVRPAARKLERIALVDVQEPDRGINRPVGSTGEDDAAFDTRERRAVPSLAGTTFGQASRRLADRGLAAGFDGKGLPPDNARVTASDPPAGTELRFGEYVMLSVAGGASGGSPGGGSGGESGSGSSGTSAPPGSASSPPVGPSTSAQPSSSSGTSSSGPPSSAPPSEAPSSRPPSSSAPPSEEPTTTAPPPETSAPPTSAPLTSSAPPPPPPSPPETSSAPPPPPPETSAPATSAPATSEPASPDGPTASATT
ncbi:PASTA domain-containing protein [Streptomyces dysideae]|uniref:PASTA domain-containing protein n=1 Tax=Streptomyces dysideae TaxID=909626 RepID=A0A117RYS8_9ACTN|nr:PASTA domain-containing protein [Streptomyces dysideae]KUO17207.1 hypothetical protein AQJ91_32085 [Streptomyces dysideae]